MALAMAGTYVYIDMLADRSASGAVSGGIRFYNNGASPISAIYGYRGTSDILGSLVFYTSNSEQVRINENGNVGIGTTAPGAKLSVVVELELELQIHLLMRLLLLLIWLYKGPLGSNNLSNCSFGDWRKWESKSRRRNHYRS